MLVTDTSLLLPPLTCGGIKDPITSFWGSFPIHGVLGDTDPLGSMNTGSLLEEARAWTGVPAIPTFWSELVSWMS